MVKPRWGNVVRRVHSLLDEGVLPALSDRELLERYARSGPESAGAVFAALVDRHGPMVLRVCRTVLRDEHAAQDAFQATFLVLARKAASLLVQAYTAAGQGRISEALEGKYYRLEADQILAEAGVDPAKEPPVAAPETDPGPPPPAPPPPAPPSPSPSPATPR